MGALPPRCTSCQSLCVESMAAIASLPMVCCGALCESTRAAAACTSYSYTKGSMLMVLCQRSYQQKRTSLFHVKLCAHSSSSNPILLCPSISGQMGLSCTAN
eukprot:scaffold10157_cov35-Tisochrysis_lutea.AAC.2